MEAPLLESLDGRFTVERVHRNRAQRLIPVLAVTSRLVTAAARDQQFARVAISHDHAGDMVIGACAPVVASIEAHDDPTPAALITVADSNFS